MPASTNQTAVVLREYSCRRVLYSTSHLNHLLWDLASLSFVSHVFQPSLTFFPGNSGDDPNGSDDGVGEGTRKVMETSEATVCAQLVSVGGSHALKANFGCQKSEMCLRICWHDETVTAVGEGT